MTQKGPSHPGGALNVLLRRLDGQQILPVGGHLHGLPQRPELVQADPALPEGGFLNAAHVPPAVLEGVDGLGGGEQAVGAARVQPYVVVLQGDDLQIPPAEELQVDVGDLQFAPGGGVSPAAMDSAWLV